MITPSGPAEVDQPTALRTALEAVACHEPVPLHRATQLIGPQALADARRAGLVKVANSVVRMAFPVHGEIIRARVALRQQQDVLRIQSGYSTSMDLMVIGELDEGDEIAHHGYRDAIAAGATRTAGDWCALRGVIAKLRGHIAAAITILREAVTLLNGSPRRQFCVAELAGAYAMAGSRGEALAWCDRIGDSRIASVELNRAWVLGSARHAMRAAAIARACGQPAIEATALYDAARLGAPDEARARLTALTKVVPGGTVLVMSLAVDGLSKGRADVLDLAARSFAQLRLPLFAAEVATVASVLYRRGGDTLRATRSLECAAIQRFACQGAETPMLRHDGPTTALTDREREVTVLAATGLTSPAIARRLELSVRTVDNYLGRVYVKLGIVGRQDLKPLFGSVEQVSRIVS